MSLTPELVAVRRVFIGLLGSSNIFSFKIESCNLLTFLAEPVPPAAAVLRLTGIASTSVRIFSFSFAVFESVPSRTRKDETVLVDVRTTSAVKS